MFLERCWESSDFEGIRLPYKQATGTKEKRPKGNCIQVTELPT